MNLYRVLFEHHSPKDAEIGIKTYLLASNNEGVYNFITNDNRVNSGWEYYQEETYTLFDEECNVIGTETFKEKVIKAKGDMFDEELSENVLQDLYYGATVFGWELVKENITNEESELLIKTGIAVK